MAQQFRRQVRNRNQLTETLRLDHVIVLNFVAGGASGDESSAHESSDSDNIATNCAIALGKAIHIFQRGNQYDKAFAKTVTKRIQHLPYSSKLRALEALNDVERSANSRKRKRERFEEIENENELKNG